MTKDLLSKFSEKHVKPDEFFLKDKYAYIKHKGCLYKRKSLSDFIDRGLDLGCCLDKDVYISNKLSENFGDLYLESIDRVGGKRGKTYVVVFDNDGNRFRSRLDSILDNRRPRAHACYDKERFVISEMRKAHNDRYAYSDFKYKSNSQKIEIICPDHGMFSQTIMHHRNRLQGCPRCAVPGIKKFFNESHKDKKGFLYLIRMGNSKEKFLKVGVTGSLESRLKAIKSESGYSCEYIKTVHGGIVSLFEKEQIIINNYKRYSYSPMIKFSGHTECFDIIIEKAAADEIIY
jgi:hypothetical protein